MSLQHRIPTYFTYEIKVFWSTIKLEFIFILFFSTNYETWQFFFTFTCHIIITESIDF